MESHGHRTPAPKTGPRCFRHVLECSPLPIVFRRLFAVSGFGSGACPRHAVRASGVRIAFIPDAQPGDDQGARLASAGAAW